MNRLYFGDSLQWLSERTLFESRFDFPGAVNNLIPWDRRFSACGPPRILALLLLMGVLSTTANGQKEAPLNIHNEMMRITCKISGDGSIGTGFIVGKTDPAEENRFFYILITADHVLSDAKGENVTLTLRREKERDHWERVDFRLRIRSGSKPLWHKHPDVDLAGMLVGLPDDAMKNGVLPPTLLLKDDKIREYEITAGTELLCLGYPLGAEGNPQGFPILRSGKIASYPLLPTKEVKTFLFDFRVFPGNSGGPVYLYRENPVYGGGTHLGAIFGLIGVVTSEQSVVQTIQQLYEKREVQTPLSLAGVIPASFILELLDLIPIPSEKK
jgi:hypothetical protein